MVINLPTNKDSPIRQSDTESTRNRFHATARPSSLPCRENEYAEILGGLESAIDSGDGACICK